MTQEPYAIGIVGLGKIAADQHVPAIKADPRFRLAGFVSGRGATVDGLPSLPTIEALLEACPEISVLSLCTPPSGRLPLAEAALRAGRHVMLEKPPAATLAEAEAIAALGAEYGRTMFATWHSRFNAGVERAQALLAGHRLRRLHIDWQEDVRYWHPNQAWIWQPGGFGIFDPAINAFSIATAITPTPLFVTASTIEIAENHATPIAAQLRFATPGMASDAALTATLDWRQEGPPSWNIEIETVAGLSVTLREGGGRLFVNGAEETLPPPGEYPRIYARMAELLATGASEVDLRPLKLVADAFLLGERKTVPFFAD